ncbi:MAG: ATP-binding protein [Bacillota bacterium]
MRIYPVFLFVLILSLNCNAQEFIIRNYHLDATTKNPFVYEISQDKNGYIWFSTFKGGLYNFDGRDFKYFSEAEGFSSSKVNFISSDSQGNLWIFTSEKELFCYDGKKFHKYLIPAYVAGKTFADIKGTCWFPLLNGIYKKNKSKFELVIPRARHELYWLAKDSKDNLLVLYRKFADYDEIRDFSKNKKVLKLQLFSYDGKKLILLKTLPKVPPQSFFVDHEDNIWIGLEGKVIKFERKNNLEVNFKSEYPEEKAEKIIQDKAGDIWFASKHHVYKIEDSKARCIFSIKDDNKGKPSISSSINTLFCDKDNNIWVASTKSLTKISRNYLSFIGKSKSLSDYQQKSSVLFYIDRKNNKWFSNLKEVLVYDSSNRKIFQIKNPYEKRFISATEDASGNTWLDCEKGLMKYDGKKITNFPKINFNKGPFVYTSRLKFWKDSSLYILSTNLISKFKDGSFKYYSIFHDIASFTSLLSSCFNSSWYMSLENKYLDKRLISVLNGQTIKDIDLISAKNRKNENQRIRIAEPILEDKYSIWAFINYSNDSNELVQIEKGTLNVHRFDQNNGMPAGRVWCHLFDKSGNLWFLIRGKGFFRLDIQRYYQTKSAQFTSFPYLEGHQDNTSNPYLDDQGNIWVLSDQGWTKFNPSGLKITNYYPDVKLTAVDLFFSSHIIEKFAVGDKNINGIPKSLRLPYDENHLTFEFSAPNYSDPEDVKYSYILEGADKQWSPIVSANKVTYPSLSPGKYTFRVRAFSRDGLSGKEDLFSFEITSPYWSTWWFVLLMAIGLLCLIYTVIRIIIQTAQKKRLEQLVELRTRQLQEEKEKVELQRSEIQKEKEKIEVINSELEKSRYQLLKINEFQTKWLEELSASEQMLQEVNQSKDKFFSIISHDLKSPVNAIIRYTDFILEKLDDLKPEEVKEYLNNLSNSTRKVYHLVEDLLDWSRIQIGKVEVRKKQYNLSAQVKEMAEVQSGNLVKKNIRLYENIDDEINICADENMLRSILHNLISNAVKFTSENGAVRIEAHKTGSYAEVSVIDDGIGISAEDFPKLFSLDAQLINYGTAGEKGTGLGLILCKEMIEKNDGSIYVESILGKGSTFSFRIPLAESYAEADV